MNDLLELALQGHGGLDRWKDVERIDVGVSLTGGLYAVKGQPQGMRNVRMHVDVRKPHVTVSPFPAKSQVGRFDDNRVSITDGKGETIDALNDARGAFDGKLMSQWSPLQLLYFNAYAMWNYLTVPFLFTQPGFELTKLAAHHEGNEVWRPLKVVYPDGIPTHCKEQVFYFDDKGLLKRIDYQTDVAGGVAAHYCYDHMSFGGLVFPTLRRVVRRTPEGSWPSLPTAILIQIDDVFVA